MIGRARYAFQDATGYENLMTITFTFVDQG